MLALLAEQGLGQGIVREGELGAGGRGRGGGSGF
jgi:hypothetical protein